MTQRVRAAVRADAGWVLLAGILTVMGQLEAWALMEPTAAEALVAAATTLPLALVGRSPYLALALTHGVLVAHALVTRSDDFVFAALMATMATLYGVAARVPLRRAAPALPAALLLANLGIAADPSTVAGDHVFSVVLLSVPWLAGAAVRHWQQQALELARLGAELQAAQDVRVRLGVVQERMRVARDLHDSTAQALNAVIVHAEAAEEALSRHPDGVGPALRRIQQVSRAALADTRQVVEALRGATDADPEPRLAHLERLVTTFTSAGVLVDCHVATDGASLPAAIEAAAYRVVQESLTNVLKHSASGRAEVSIDRHGDDLLVRVTDPGPARSSGSETGGHGHAGMRERVSLLGGELALGHGPGGGFQVSARLPIGSPP